jgi:D-proline reductase (dithiol) PrdB
VCHQTVSLVARYLEEHGIPTVVIATARDIVEYCGVARLVFTDFPLGNPCGEPYDDAMQREIVGMALDLLAEAQGPRTTIEAPFAWSKGTGWKDLIFSEEQPFLEGEAYDNWMAGKQRYRELKKMGKL